MGPRLGTFERACFRSVLRQGHPLHLFCYDPPEGVPDGVSIVDAAQVLPRSEVIRYRSGSVALFSNRFRYELLRREAGTWIDSDVYLLQPLDGTRDYLVGEQAPGELGTAVLRLPPGSQLLEALIEPFAEKSVPSWLPWRIARLAAHARMLLTGRTGVAAMPWGTTGPNGLTALARPLLAEIDPLPPAILYPVHWREADWIARPETSIEDVVAPQSVAVHLWNEKVKHLKDLPAAPGSFLARLHLEGR